MSIGVALKSGGREQKTPAEFPSFTFFVLIPQTTIPLLDKGVILVRRQTDNHTDRQTDRQTDRHTSSHTAEIIVIPTEIAQWLPFCLTMYAL